MKVSQAVSGGRKGGIGPVLLDPLSVFIPAQIHAHVIELPLIVKRDVPFHRFSSHDLSSLSLSIFWKMA